ncbi:MAG: quinoprotein relay system zinc metallohydrolase 2 [Hyphomicrobiaceae bacterium]|nr:quinoprotein relay system zinc metallohydrolase 2 [Hyphomicrobiaceae bacterium]
MGLAATGLPVSWLPEVAWGANQVGPAPVEEIAPGVFIHRGVHALASAGNGGDICNAGFVVGTSGVAVIDTGGSLRTGAAIRAAIAAKTPLPVTHVINTHMHPDHVLGNAAFAADKPVFAGHHKLLRALSERSEGYLEAAKEQLGSDAFAGTDIVLPTLGVESESKIDLGGRTLTLTARPTAHTNNDLTVRDSSTDTVFLGDLVFVEHLPTLDGSLRGWLKLLDVLETEPAARVVPGHGPVSMAWPAAATDVKRYLNVLAADVRKSIAAGSTMTSAMETAAQGEKDKWQLFAEHNARNVSGAFAELEWE